MSEANNPLPGDKADLMARIERGWEALEATIGGLREAQLNEAGGDGWSIKDHLAHLTAWHRWLLGYHFQGQAAHEILGTDPETAAEADTGQINEIIRRQHAGQPVAAVIAALRDSHAEVISALEAMPFETIMQPRYPEEPEAGPLLNWIIGNTYEHYEEHAPAIAALVARAEP